jgi:hypothetical protein
MASRNKVIPPSFQPPQSPHQDFIVVVHVIRPISTPSAWPHEECMGYYQKLGCRAAPRRLKQLIESEVKSGNIDWQDTEWERVNVQDLDRYILDRFVPVDGEGVWFRGSLSLYEHE